MVSREFTQDLVVAMVGLILLTGCAGQTQTEAQGQFTEHQGKILFDSVESPDKTQISVMDADGSNVQRLTHNDKIDARPAWSPDGQRIVFHSNHEIFVMDADGGNVEQLTSDNGEWSHPDW